MRTRHAFCFKVFLCLAVLLLLYYLLFNVRQSYTTNITVNVHLPYNKTNDYNLWFIFTNGNNSYRLRQNLRDFISSFLDKSTNPLSIHAITDDESKPHLEHILKSHENKTLYSFTVSYYNIHIIADLISDIIETMQTHFTAQPGSYYSDSAFFVSLGIHRIALDQKKCILLDIDTRIKGNTTDLFDLLDKMPKSAAIAAAPEQTPVYRHVLHMYRAAHRRTKFGDPLSMGGNPGVNSGVLLLNLDKQRTSKLFQNALKRNAVRKLCAKYQFHGHLGDQDFYTLLSQEHPQLVQFLPCAWNRQLCLWWRHHGYRDIFDMFHKCDQPARILHGNCNTPIPEF